MSPYGKSGQARQARRIPKPAQHAPGPFPAGSDPDRPPGRRMRQRPGFPKSPVRLADPACFFIPTQLLYPDATRHASGESRASLSARRMPPAFNPNRSLDFGEIARLCHAACFWPGRRRSGLPRGIAGNRMRTEAGKMPECLILPIGNGSGVPNDRFGLMTGPRPWDMPHWTCFRYYAKIPYFCSLIAVGPAHPNRNRPAVLPLLPTEGGTTQE